MGVVIRSTCRIGSAYPRADSIPIFPTWRSNHPFTAFSEHHRGEGFVLEDLQRLANGHSGLTRTAHLPATSLHRLANFLRFEKTFYDPKCDWLRELR